MNSIETSCCGEVDLAFLELAEVANAADNLFHGRSPSLESVNELTLAHHDAVGSRPTQQIGMLRAMTWESALVLSGARLQVRGRATQQQISKRSPRYHITWLNSGDDRSGRGARKTSPRGNGS